MSEQKTLRLIIADDHALVRAGLVAYLQPHPHVQLLGEAESGDDAIQLCEMLKPDLVLMDDHMPGIHSPAAVQTIRQRWPHIQVVMLLSEMEDTFIRSCQEAGAAGCLSKNSTPQELLQGLENALAHRPITPTPRGRAAEPTRHALDGKPIEVKVAVPHKQTMLEELEMAGRIQHKILPEKPPVIDGWDISAVLEPALETSGDFYDFIPLAYGKMGIVIGDVANKGLGAAIFMALCNSLMRTYATHFPIMPGMMINAVNERLNADTRSNMFVTTFYGVLDPKLNRLIYVNAGHNPPIMVSSNKGKPVDQLGTTGPALGIFEKTSWTQKITKFAPGDVLLLYTDGITEAQNQAGEFFDEQRLLKALRASKDQPAARIQQSVLRTLNRFTGSAPRDDDVALIVIRREG